MCLLLLLARVDSNRERRQDLLKVIKQPLLQNRCKQLAELSELLQRDATVSSMIMMCCLAYPGLVRVTN